MENCLDFCHLEEHLYFDILTMTTTRWLQSITQILLLDLCLDFIKSVL